MSRRNAIFYGKDSTELIDKWPAPSTEKAIMQDHDYASIMEWEHVLHKALGERELMTNH